MRQINRKRRITFFGSCLGKTDDPDYEAMFEAGRLVAKKGIIVVTGAGGGLGMEAPAKGARQVGGLTIGYTIKGLYPINDFIVKYHFCGWWFQATSIKMGLRLGYLMSSDSFILSASRAREGTLNELFQFIALSAKFGSRIRKRLAILMTGKPSFDKDLLKYLNLKGVISTEALVSVKICESPEEAISWVTFGWPNLDI